MLICLELLQLKLQMIDNHIFRHMLSHSVDQLHLRTQALFAEQARKPMYRCRELPELLSQWINAP